MKTRTLSLSILFALCTNATRATTWVVDPGGQGDFTSIKPAVAAASAPDTILVRPGTYLEWVSFGPDKSGIRLEGDGPREQIIIQSDTVAVSAFDTDPAVRIENLTLTGSQLYGALWLQQSKVEIVGCVIRDNVGPGACHGVGGGGRIHTQSDVRVEDCLFENNHSWESPGGLIVWNSRADIRGNVFRNNSSCYGGGLEIYHCEANGTTVIEGNLFIGNNADTWGGGLLNVDSSPQIRTNTFVDNGGPGHAAIWVLGGSPDIHHNIIVGSDEAVHCQTLGGYPPSTPVIGDNICWDMGITLSNCASAGALRLADPLFCDAAGGDFGLCQDSPAVENGTAVYGAFGVACAACGSTPAKPVSWGSLKTLFGGAAAPADSASRPTGGRW